MPAVELVDAQPLWAQQFAELALGLRPALAPSMRLEHIGSTAVPGLCAKPVLDLLIGADELQAFDGQVEALARLGFVYRSAYEGEMPERRYFVRAAQGASPRVHAHGVVRGGPLWQAHLAFRDRLRADAAVREAYAALKRELARRHADDKAAYTEAKAPFILQVLGGAAGL